MNPIALQLLLDKVQIVTELLEHSDVQMRMMMNLVATSKRRIADVETERVSLKRLLGDANRLLVAVKSSNRDMRVKMLYDERESKKKVERLIRESRAGHSISPESQDAVERLERIRGELKQLCPAFAEEVEFLRQQVFFVDENGRSDKASNIRVTCDLSGRQWLSLNDLIQCSSPLIARVAAAVDLAKLGEVEKIMCFRPFTTTVMVEENTEKRTEYLVSIDWSVWRGTLQILPAQ